ncbi:MAG: PQQ-dependent sugar dehydrogenase, partial [Cyclobacteriaceae bacterium]
LVMATAACSPPRQQIPVSNMQVNEQVLAEGFEIPYAIEVLDENDFLVTERMGGLFRYIDGELFEVSGIPQSQTFTTDRPYGGMMEVSLHPKFDENQLVYLAYVNTSYAMSVVRFRLDGTSAQDMEEIFSSDQFSIGARIAWQDDDHFFLTFGVGGAPKPEPGPQDLGDPRGKIFRLNADGSIPEDNPVFDDPRALPCIWSYGHPDPQGLYYDKTAGILYSNEHGPMGGDELNIIEKGGNYGWPLFSYGLNYDGSPVSEMTEEEAAKRTVLPLKYWTPSFRLAPSCLILLRASNFSEWNNSFLMGGLLYQQIIRYDPGTDLTEAAMERPGRVRDIKQLPGGDLVILVEHHSPAAGYPGRIIKLSPGK